MLSIFLDAIHCHGSNITVMRSIFLDALYLHGSNVKLYSVLECFWKEV